VVNEFVVAEIPKADLQSNSSRDGNWGSIMTYCCPEINSRKKRKINQFLYFADITCGLLEL